MDLHKETLTLWEIAQIHDDASARDALYEHANRDKRDSWLYPRFRALLADAAYFARASTDVSRDDLERARSARASVIFSSAAIEATSNDALEAVCQLLGDSWPSECRNDAPWRHFRRLSCDRARKLADRGSIKQRTDYLLERISRVTLVTIGDDLSSELAKVSRIRNRIVHLRSLARPNHLPSVMNANQASHVACAAVLTAKRYLEVIEDGFEEMNLAIFSVKGHV